ncbi:hypothetical protein JYT85_02860 [Desulfocapsa sp. AH-315-G09]|nr:hypothetical protein [Desulfocapsa sp. AH-315-G09]
MRDDKYLTCLNKALLSFQMIEESLKLCIGLSYEVIAGSIPSDIAFKFSPESINNAALGRLIRMFANISKNETLIDDLQKVVNWRNFCAHNAYAHEFLKRNSNSLFTQHSAEDLGKVSIFSSDLVLRLSNELKKIQKIHTELISSGI